MILGSIMIGLEIDGLNLELVVLEKKVVEQEILFIAVTYILQQRRYTTSVGIGRPATC